MNVTIPETLKSSKGDNKLSRTIKGLAGVIVLGAAMYTPLTEAEVVQVINQLLVAGSAIYSLYGLGMKLYNAHYGTNR